MELTIVFVLALYWHTSHCFLIICLYFNFANSFLYMCSFSFLSLFIYILHVYGHLSAMNYLLLLLLLFANNCKLHTFATYNLNFVTKLLSDMHNPNVDSWAKFEKNRPDHRYIVQPLTIVKIIFKWCNVVRFGVYLDQILS